MPHEGEVRSVSVFDLVTSDNTVTVLPIRFGVGRRDLAVRIHSVHYTVTQWDLSDLTSFDQWAACLSEDPEHERTAPAGGIAVNIGLLSCYAWVFEANDRRAASGLGFHIREQRTHHMEMHGMQRPHRQRVLFFNEVGGAAQFRCEVLYTPVELGRDDLDTLNRTKGAYRRT